MVTRAEQDAAATEAQRAGAKLLDAAIRGKPVDRRREIYERLFGPADADAGDGDGGVVTEPESG